jgi:hypothetical protein
MTTSLIDNTAAASTVYRYKVRAVDNASTPSADSNIDLATTVIFTDDPIVAGATPVKALHWSEVLSAVNLVRGAAGLAPATFADTPAPGGAIKALHATQLRTAIDPARSILGVPAIVYSNPQPVAGSAVRAAHLRELRDGVK